MTVDEVLISTETQMDSHARSNRDSARANLAAQGFDAEYIEAVCAYLHSEYDRSKTQTLKALRDWLQQWQRDGKPPERGPFENNQRGPA